jgi:hypothetical protein
VNSSDLEKDVAKVVLFISMAAVFLSAMAAFVFIALV